MRHVQVFVISFFLLFSICIVSADPEIPDILTPELTDTGEVSQKDISVPDQEWETKGIAKAFIYLAGYKGEITIEDDHYIPKPASECALIYTKTKNIAKRPAGQTSTIRLSDGEDGTLKVKLTVISKYQIKDYKTVLGIRIPYYRTKTQTKVFTRTFTDVPPKFPTFEPPKAYVTHYNGSHAVVNVDYVDKDGNVIDVIGKVDVSIPGSSAREYRLIGEVGTAENGFRSAHFEKVSTWKYSGKQISRSQSGLYIKEPFDIDNLTITVSTPYMRNVPVTDIEYVVIEDTSRKFLNVGFLVMVVYFLTYGRTTYILIKREVTRWNLRSF